MNTFRTLGWVVRSDLLLPAPTVDGSTAADCEVRLASNRRIGTELPSGKLLAELRRGRRGYAVSRHESGHTLRLFDTCDLCFDQHWSRCDIHLAPTSPPQLAAIALAGTGLSVALTLLGNAVLHASAITTSGSAVAFAGPSGTGKSTLAMLACMEGAELVADDALRLDIASDEVTCHATSTALRLRRHAALRLSLGDRNVHHTVDGRLSVAVPVSPSTPVPLRAIILPSPSREHASLQLVRIAGAAAVFRLLGCARLSGLVDATALQRQLQLTAEVARRVPVFEGLLPWGPPYPADLGRAVMRLATHPPGRRLW